MIFKQQTNIKGDRHYVVMFDDDGTEYTRVEVERPLTDEQFKYFCTEVQRRTTEILENLILYGSAKGSKK